MRPLLALLAALALPLAAAAHPLGNFTVNRWAAVRAAPSALTVRYIVDMAEIPALQAVAAMDRDADGSAAPAEREAWAARTVAELAAGFRVRLDGAPVAFVASVPRLVLPPGAGGLPTLRLEVSLAAPLRAARGAVEVHDTNFAGRPGWQEIIADGDEGVSLVGSTVPRTDRSAALTAYPTDLLATPPEVTRARFTLAPGGTPAVAPPEATRPERGAVPRRDRFTELVTAGVPLGPGMMLGALLTATLLGALHALGPGHGKAIVGAWLVGTRGTARHALALGLVVTATHTTGVFALGGVTLLASRWILPERLFPWLGLASGLVVVSIGASLATARLGHAHEHRHDDGHTDRHAHAGHHHRRHHHAPAAPGWRGVVALGVSGGLLPCPSALVVMLGAIALGRVAFGLVLVTAFSAGLAAVLVAIGLAFVYARAWLERLPAAGRLARWAPVASAVVVSVAGVLLVVQALAELRALA